MPEVHAVGGPSAWLGSEMQARSDWIVELDDTQRSELRDALRRAESRGGKLLDLTREDFPVPSLDPLVSDVVEELLDGRGFTVLRGMPLEGLSESQIELMYWGLGLQVGIALPQDVERVQLFAHVRDEGVDRNATLGAALLNRHNQALPFHTDSSDFVGLLCIHPAMRGGMSTLVSSAAVHDELFRRRKNLLEIMYEPWWFDRRLGDRPESFAQCPVFAVNDEGKLFAFYAPDLYKSAPRGEGIPPLSTGQVEAMAALDEINAEPTFQHRMNLERGDVQLINNYAVMHSRTSYEDSPDPALRRDLIRLWLTLERDLAVPASFVDRGIVPRGAAFAKS